MSVTWVKSCVKVCPAHNFNMHRAILFYLTLTLRQNLILSCRRNTGNTRYNVQNICPIIRTYSITNFYQKWFKMALTGCKGDLERYCTIKSVVLRNCVELLPKKFVIKNQESHLDWFAEMLSYHCSKTEL
jgi:hypothetical protein